MNNLIKDIIIKYFIFALLLLIFSCNSRHSLNSINWGQQINLNGEIINKSLHYKFKHCNHCKTALDFCNYVYFQGDTLCFSFNIDKSLNEKDIKIYFINPNTNKHTLAERFDIINNTISGFSLIGSLLEQLYLDDVKNLIKYKQYRFPITLFIQINSKDFIHSIRSSNKFFISITN